MFNLNIEKASWTKHSIANLLTQPVLVLRPIRFKVKNSQFAYDREEARQNENKRFNKLLRKKGVQKMELRDLTRVE